MLNQAVAGLLLASTLSAARAAAEPFLQADIPSLRLAAAAQPSVPAPAAKDPVQLLSSAIEELDRLQDGNSLGCAAPEDQAAYLRALNNLHRAQSGLADQDRSGQAVEAAIFVQSLLGKYVVGSSISGPILRKEPFELEVDVRFAALVSKYPFLGAVTNGRIRVNPGENVAAQYQALRAEFIGRLGGAISAAGREPRTIALARWARSLRILSQPDCLDIFTRLPWPDFCS
ncbi:MAG: hypothetical protein AAB320_03310 [Elusimicrobiota bacterium]